MLLGNFATQSAVAGGAQLERGDQEPGERSLVADAEPLDGHVICGLVGGKDSEGEVLSAATLDLREERTLIQ